MGLFDGLLGNASKIDNAAIQQEFAQVLAPGEVVEHAYKLIRDYFDPEDLHQETEHLRGAVGACRVCFELSAQVASVKNRAARLASILIHPVVVMEIAATVAGSCRRRSSRCLGALAVRDGKCASSDLTACSITRCRRLPGAGRSPRLFS